MATRGFDYQPDKDAGLGLIYRLNNLWASVDRKVESGNLEGANYTLDRIYCNLLYRNPLDITYDEDGNVSDVKLSDEDSQIYDLFEKRIASNRLKKKRAILTKNKKEEYLAGAEFYKIIRLKDIWLRKHMQKLKLYLRESENNPGRAMFGGAK